jgi:coenzyme F420 hydrogenase subunit beta
MYKSDSEGLYVPKIEEEKCNQCGLCIKACPGYLVDFEELNLSFFGKQPEDTSIGNFLRCYIGHSNNDDIRYNASSGGIATQLLIFALEKGIIDGALVARMRKDRPLEPEPFIARTREEVLSASKSKYCPVATNEALKQILKENGKFAVVGLPCHIHGLRKAEMLNKKLREKVIFHIGLFCSHTGNFRGTEFLLRKLNVKKSDVARLDYRGRGWPGGMSLRLKDGSERFVPYHEYYSILGSLLFTPQRCILCADATNEFGDISLGDAWLPEFRDNRKGISIIITRSKTGERVLKDAQFDGKITIIDTTICNVIRSQKNNLKFKKEEIMTRLLMWRFFSKATPNFHSSDRSKKPRIMFLPAALLCYFITQVSARTPSSLLRLLLVFFLVQTKISLLIRRFLFSRSSPYWR